MPDKQLRIPALEPPAPPEPKPKVGDIKRGLEISYKNNHPYRWSICPVCGDGRWVVYPGHTKEKTYTGICKKCYGQTRRGDKNPHWKGGYKKRGYIYIRVTPDSPFYPMVMRDGYVPEHRLIMAQSLGRSLHPGEVVHHQNGIKDDNRLINLFLVAQSTHPMSYEKAYRQGYKDGAEARNVSLEKQIRLLRWEIKQLKEALQLKLGEE